MLVSIRGSRYNEIVCIGQEECLVGLVWAFDCPTSLDSDISFLLPVLDGTWISDMQSHPETAKQALESLLEGNQRHVAGKPIATNPPGDRPGHLAGQTPIAAIIRCADSRVAPEIIFDQPLGKLFVCGVAGNLATTEIIASLEYAVLKLNTPLIRVMGHPGCGAVQAALDYREEGVTLSSSLQELIAQVEMPESPSDLNDNHLSVIEHNARTNAEHLVTRSPILKDRVGSGKLGIISGVQDVGTGKFTLQST